MFLRENTERPEAIKSGIAKLVGNDPGSIASGFSRKITCPTNGSNPSKIANPFGDGKSAAAYRKSNRRKTSLKTAFDKCQQKSLQFNSDKMKGAAKNTQHLLTILVEDYFHVGAFENLIQQRNWSNFEPRYEQNTLKALDLLDEYDSKGDLFCAWVDRGTKSCFIREIVARGHEVASRGYYHRSLKNLTDEEFREDLRRTNKAIEAACGQKVLGYRAAEKLAYCNNDWVLNVLADEGFAYDASFMPNVENPKAKRFAQQIMLSGKAIWEFPYSTLDLGLGLLPISGGNYFRQIPYTLMRHAVQQLDTDGRTSH